jgi:hypothetical protein
MQMVHFGQDKLLGNLDALLAPGVIPQLAQRLPRGPPRRLEVDLPLPGQSPENGEQVGPVVLLAQAEGEQVGPFLLGQGERGQHFQLAQVRGCEHPRPEAGQGPAQHQPPLQVVLLYRVARLFLVVHREVHVQELPDLLDQLCLYPGVTLAQHPVQQLEYEDAVLGCRLSLHDPQPQRQHLLLTAPGDTPAIPAASAAAIHHMPAIKQHLVQPIALQLDLPRVERDLEPGAVQQIVDQGQCHFEVLALLALGDEACYLQGLEGAGVV